MVFLRMKISLCKQILIPRRVMLKKIFKQLFAIFFSFLYVNIDLVAIFVLFYLDSFILLFIFSFFILRCYGK